MNTLDKNKLITSLQNKIKNISQMDSMNEKSDSASEVLNELIEEINNNTYDIKIW